MPFRRPEASCGIQAGRKLQVSFNILLESGGPDKEWKRKWNLLYIYMYIYICLCALCRRRI